MTITPVLLVEAIEPCLRFWIDVMGFEKTAEVPEGDRLGFVMLQSEGAQVMLQTLESARKDIGLHNVPAEPSSNLFIVVDNFDEVLPKALKADVVLPVRTTFYGMKEILVREPGGHYVCFASPVAG